ncbi:MAG: hypothetical protein ACR65Z_02350 [Methylocystis sp.]
MANPAGESSGEVLRLSFNWRLMLQLHSSVTSDANGHGLPDTRASAKPDNDPGGYPRNIGFYLNSFGEQAT